MSKRLDVSAVRNSTTSFNEDSQSFYYTATLKKESGLTVSSKNNGIEKKMKCCFCAIF